jgi:hypothetical protein
MQTKCFGAAHNTRNDTHTAASADVSQDSTRDLKNATEVGPGATSAAPNGCTFVRRSEGFDLKTAFSQTTLDLSWSETAVWWTACVSFSRRQLDRSFCDVIDFDRHVFYAFRQLAGSLGSVRHRSRDEHGAIHFDGMAKRCHRL